MRDHFLRTVGSQLGGAWGGRDPLAAFSVDAAYDPFNTASMFQDDAGTTLAIPSVDAVGRMSDVKSDIHHAVQSFPASRALYMTDGTLYWVESDGVDDFLEIAEFRTAGNAQSMMFVASFEAQGGWPFLVGEKDTPNRGLEVALDGNSLTLVAVGSTISGNAVATASDVAISRPYIFRVKLDPATGLVSLYVDGALQATANAPVGDFSLATAITLFRGYGITKGKVKLYRGAIRDGDWPTAEGLAADAWGNESGVATKVYTVGDSVIAEYGGNIGLMELLGSSANNPVEVAYPNDTISQQLTRWNATMAGPSATRWVYVQLGHNNIITLQSAASILGELQGLVDAIRADVGPNVSIIIGQMTPARQNMVSQLGEVSGEQAYQNWLAVNEGIAGNGPNAIEGVQGRVTAHVAAMDDGAGNLRPEHDSSDNIHPNAAGRLVNKDAVWDELVALGLEETIVVSDSLAAYDLGGGNPFSVADFVNTTYLGDGVPLSVSRAQPAHIVNSSGNFELVPADTIRAGNHTYNPASGLFENAGALIEPARNYFNRHSADPAQVWRSGNTVISDGPTIMGLPSKRMSATAFGDTKLQFWSIDGLTQDAEYIIHAVLKRAVGSGWVRLFQNTFSASWTAAHFNLTNGAIGTLSPLVTGSETIEIGPGVYAVGFSFIATTTTGDIYLEMCNADNSGNAEAGDAIDILDINMSEGGSIPSLIQCGSSAVLRDADLVGFDTIAAGTYDLQTIADGATSPQYSQGHAGGDLWPSIASGNVERVLAFPAGNLP